MQVLQIDLFKNPEVAQVVSDMQPGDDIIIHGTIKALDDQTLTVTVEEVEQGSELAAPGGTDPNESAMAPNGGSAPAAQDLLGGEQSAT